ncbi:MAG: GCG_CRPN prefix-to-repeats domain-containing protein [Bradyrhizobium sp.]
MKILAASVLALGLGFAATSASQAMPVAPLDQAQAASDNAIRVAGGCGPGWHRGPYGGCRPMYNCPRGWHSGPFGRRCFRNW